LSVADRDWRWLQGLYPVAGAIFVALAIAPWVVAMERVTEGAFLAGSLGEDFWSKLIGAQESHGAPPLAYLLLAIATFWPGSLLLPALAHAWRRACPPNVSRLVGAGRIALELLPTVPRTCPLYPALALLKGPPLEGARVPPPPGCATRYVAGVGP
jgi:4-amino-4-deoxy-L-arabinose transferase-like glycosyltransferase